MATQKSETQESAGHIEYVVHFTDNQETKSHSHGGQKGCAPSPGPVENRPRKRWSLNAAVFI